jgi:hypothetical protein
MTDCCCIRQNMILEFVRVWLKQELSRLPLDDFHAAQIQAVSRLVSESEISLEKALTAPFSSASIRGIGKLSKWGALEGHITCNGLTNFSGFCARRQDRYPRPFHCGAMRWEVLHLWHGWHEPGLRRWVDLDFGDQFAAQRACPGCYSYRRSFLRI